jgi:hypothetical protein
MADEAEFSFPAYKTTTPSQSGRTIVPQRLTVPWGANNKIKKQLIIIINLTND